MQKNAPQVWDKVWDDPGFFADYPLILATEAATIRWQRIKAVVIRQLGSFKGLRVLEIGSGVGTYAALMSKEGAKSTLLDYSKRALERAKDFHHNNQLPVTLVQGDALNMPAKLLKGKFDISISVGLTEHFRDQKRLQINKAHLNVLRPGGLAILIVPNAANPPYRIFKWVAERLGRWKYGEEYPYTRAELLDICQRLGAQHLALFGDNLITSIRFVLPAHFLRRLFGVDQPRSLAEIKPERGTWLDAYLGYSLILVMKKK